MQNDEIEIMRDAFCFLRDHNDPPGRRRGIPEGHAGHGELRGGEDEEQAEQDQ